MNQAKRNTHLSSASSSKQKILLLQGPIGPFFAELQNHLKDLDFDVKHVIFNFADLFYSSKSDTKVFRGRERGWRGWLHQYMEEHQFDLLILFGCERERHAIAREIAKDKGVPILCIEEGYIRPGYITVEPDGNNRLSPLRDLTTDQIQAGPEGSIPVAAKRHAFKRMALFGTCYYILRVLGLPLFRKALHHKNRPVFPEWFYWHRNFYRKVTGRSRNFIKIKSLISKHKGKFYIVPLQVRDDMQLVKAGRGWTNEMLFRKSIESFAEHAPKDRLLVIKVHPLERGHTRAEGQVRKIAEANNCSDRVIYIDDGSIGMLTRISAGMLTINSTSAFSAMFHKVPLGVAGEAMYRRDDIAHCVDSDDDLDQFWTLNQSEKLDLANKFLKYITATALVPGDYYLPRNRTIACVGMTKIIVDMLAESKRKTSKSR